MALYYRSLPEFRYVFKDEKIKCCKIAKDCITLLCCRNMAGEWKQLVVIGKSNTPHCFQGVESLPVQYPANKSAWMTSIFNEWLQKWDAALTTDILLLVDCCTAHVVQIPLRHIKVVFLPANTTSLL